MGGPYAQKERREMTALISWQHRHMINGTIAKSQAETQVLLREVKEMSFSPEVRSAGSEPTSPTFNPGFLTC